MLTFLIRDFPDLDHFVPVIFKYLKNYPTENVLIIEFNADIEIELDYRIQFLKKLYPRIIIKNAYTVNNNGLVRVLLSRLFSKKNRHINFQFIKSSKNKFNFLFFINLLIASLKKIFLKKDNFFEKFLFNNNWATELIEKFEIDVLVMDDSFYLSYNKNKELVLILQKLKRRVILLPHTCHIFEFKEEKDIFEKIKFEEFYPELVVCSNQRKKFMISYGYNENKVFNLGSARFSNEWIGIHSDMIQINKNYFKNGMVKLLVIDGTYNEKDKQSKLINKISEKIDNVDIVFRTHVRKNNYITDTKKIYNFNDKIKLDFDTPTTNLIKQADVIIGTMSSILIEVFILKKLLIFPAFLLNEKNVNTLYKSKGFSIDCINYEEVIQAILNWKENIKLINDAKREKFMNEFVYGNLDKDLILEKYSNFFKPNN